MSPTARRGIVAGWTGGDTGNVQKSKDAVITDRTWLDTARREQLRTLAGFSSSSSSPSSSSERHAGPFAAGALRSGAGATPPPKVRPTA